MKGKYQKISVERILETPRPKETAGGTAQRVSGRLAAKTRKRIVLAMFAAFSALALYTFGKAVYDIGRNDGSRMGTDHAGQVELSVKPDNNHHLTPYYNYGTDEE